MITSKLSKQITIEKESTSTNRVGTPQESYTFLKDTYADIYIQAVTTQYSTTGSLPFSQTVFTIRYDEDVDYKCRLIYNNNYFKIESIEEIGRKHWMRIRCIVWERATNY